MPERKNPEHEKRKVSLKQDDLVEQLIPDPSESSQFVVVEGFLGKSQRAGYWRLYLNAKLNEYVEVSENDVIHSQSLSKEKSSLGGTTLWLARGATLERTRIESRRLQAEFLEGDITNTFLPLTSPGSHPQPETTLFCVSVVITISITGGSVTWFLPWDLKPTDRLCREWWGTSELLKCWNQMPTMRPEICRDQPR